MKENYGANPNLVMNEKDMAAYLGISRYFLTELRKKHGLKCLIFEGQHCIYYYLPVVDEFFRSRSKGLGAEITGQSEDTAPVEAADITEPSRKAFKSQTGDSVRLPAETMPYKPMQAI